MTPANLRTPPDPRRVAEFETQLVHAVERLEPLLEHLEEIAKLLVHITATARELAPPANIEGHSVRSALPWKHLGDVIHRARVLATRITATVDELNSLLSAAPA